MGRLWRVTDCEELVGVTWSVSDCEELVGVTQSPPPPGIYDIVVFFDVIN